MVKLVIGSDIAGKKPIQKQIVEYDIHSKCP